MICGGSASPSAVARRLRRLPINRAADLRVSVPTDDVLEDMALSLRVAECDFDLAARAVGAGDADVEHSSVRLLGLNG